MRRIILLSVICCSACLCNAQKIISLPLDGAFDDNVPIQLGIKFSYNYSAYAVRLKRDWQNMKDPNIPLPGTGYELKGITSDYALGGVAVGIPLDILLGPNS